jgi:hypothetical protein
MTTRVGVTLSCPNRSGTSRVSGRMGTTPCRGTAMLVASAGRDHVSCRGLLPPAPPRAAGSAILRPPPPRPLDGGRCRRRGLFARHPRVGGATAIRTNTPSRPCVHAPLASAQDAASISWFPSRSGGDGGRAAAVKPAAWSARMGTRDHRMQTTEALLPALRHGLMGRVIPTCARAPRPDGARALWLALAAIWPGHGCAGSPPRLATRVSLSAAGPRRGIVPTPPDIGWEMLKLTGVTSNDLVCDLGSDAAWSSPPPSSSALAPWGELDARLVRTAGSGAQGRGARARDVLGSLAWTCGRPRSSCSTSPPT